MRTIILVTMILAAPASAADWTKVTEAQDGSTVFLDPSSLKSGPVRAVWVKIDYSTKTQTEADEMRKDGMQALADRGLLAEGGNSRPNLTPQDVEPDHSLQLWKFRCDDRSLAIITKVTYNALGKNISTAGTGSDDYQAIIPDSIAETVEAAVCH